LQAKSATKVRGVDAAAVQITFRPAITVVQDAAVPLTCTSPTHD
jgi:hypothetical protein